MKKLFVALFYILVSLPILAEENSKTDLPLFHYGAFAGLKINMHNADFAGLPGLPDCCPEYTGGAGIGFGLGGLFIYPLNQKLSLEGRLGFSIHGTNLTEEQVIGNTEIRDISGVTQEIVDAKSEYKIDPTLNLISLQPAINYEIIDNLILSAGIRVGYLISPSLDTKEELIEPSGVVFNESGQLTRNVSNGIDIPDANSFQVHPFVGAGYRIEIIKHTYIKPEVRYFYGATDISSVDWAFSDLHIGAALEVPYIKNNKEKVKETIYNRDTTVVPDPAIEDIMVKMLSSDSEIITNETDDLIIEQKVITENYEKRIPKTYALDANLIVVGLADDGSTQESPTVVVEETEVNEMFPVLPYVFFEQGSSQINRNVMNLYESPQQALNFKLDKLQWSTLGIYSDLLNIIGWRMQKSPESTISITGTNNNTDEETNNLQLSKERAEAVADYFYNIWGIEEDRINIESRNLPQNFANNARPEGLEENRRAELNSEDQDIISPLTLSEIEVKANPPKLKIIPIVNAESGVRKWTIGILQEGSQIEEFSGSNQPEDIIWEIPPESIEKKDNRLVMTMNVEDNNGNKKFLSQNVPLEMLTINKKRKELKEDYTYERFSLILFDYDKSEISEKHKHTLDFIKSKIKENSEIIISGYSDRTGNNAYNKELASKRTQTVADYLNLPKEKVTVNNIGSEEILYDNSTPQGRNYSRTVLIIIKTPFQE